MTETLTESFCERCGTRYEFKAPTRLNPLRKTRGFIGGLRNYLTSQDDLSDAMGDAMRSEEDTLASHQLEAFHESFNFCIDCRQYTCLNCWNNDAGRCRTCAPVAGTDDLIERLAASAVAAPIASDLEPVLAQGELEPLGMEAWPTSDLQTDIATASDDHVLEAWPEVEAFPVEPEPELAREPVSAEVEPEPEPVATGWEPEPEPITVELEPEPITVEVEEPVAAEWELEPEPITVEVEEPVAAEWELEPEPERVAVELEPEPIIATAEPEPAQPGLRVVAWDEDAAYELIEPEPVAAEVEVEHEPVAAEWERDLEPVVVDVEVEPEPVAAEVEVEAEVEPEPVAERRPRLAPIADTILRFPARPTAAPPSADDRAAAVTQSPELAARRAQLDRLGLGDPGEGPVAPDRSGPQPYRSRGAAVTQADLARQAALRGSFWEASAREVSQAGSQVGVQSCGQCGLSLSANARFCRRCGTRQAQSA